MATLLNKMAITIDMQTRERLENKRPRASAIHTLSPRMLRHWFTVVILKRVAPRRNEVQSKQTARATAATAAPGKQRSMQGSRAGAHIC